jgi:tRNA(adenine34) deaminase
MHVHESSQTDKLYMRLALEQAQLAYDQGEIPVGAVAVHKGQVIAQACNTKERARDPTAHAEITAMRLAAEHLGGWRLVDVTLYCTMEPCPMCAGAMVQARLPRLVYAIDDPKAGAAGSVLDLLDHPQLNHRVQVTKGVLAVDASDMLDRFFRDLRRGVLPGYSQAWKARQLAKKPQP